MVILSDGRSTHDGTWFSVGGICNSCCKVCIVGQ